MLARNGTGGACDESPIESPFLVSRGNAYQGHVWTKMLSVFEDLSLGNVLQRSELLSSIDVFTPTSTPLPCKDRPRSCCPLCSSTMHELLKNSNSGTTYASRFLTPRIDLRPFFFLCWHARDTPLYSLKKRSRFEVRATPLVFFSVQAVRLESAVENAKLALDFSSTSSTQAGPTGSVSSAFDSLPGLNSLRLLFHRLFHPSTSPFLFLAPREHDCAPVDDHKPRHVSNGANVVFPAQ